MRVAIERGARGAEAVEARPNAFEQLVGLMRENEGLLRELRRADERCQAARAYLLRPDCHVELGLAQLTRVRTRRSGVLAALRANRLAGEDLLASLDCGIAVN